MTIYIDAHDCHYEVQRLCTMFLRGERAPLAFGAPGEGEERFVVLTTGANASLLGVHERMPLLLTRGSLRPWLLDGSAVKGILASAPPLLRQESDAPEQQTLYCAE